jgi:hypothetical protein
VEWRYFVSRTLGGEVMEIVRRGYSGGVPGPDVQALTPDDGWVERPQVVAAFHDPGWYVPVSEDEAREAAASVGATWPS